MLSIIKAFGKKDLSKLTKQVVTDKKGHRRTVWVKKDDVKEEPKKKKKPGFMDRLKNFFGFSSKEEAKKTIKDDFRESGLAVPYEDFESTFLDYRV